MHVFVTGASGYIGGTVAVRLLQAGHQVSGLTRDPPRRGDSRGWASSPWWGRSTTRMSSQRGPAGPTPW
ncbi:NAD-dependent epimerase/dehydratase family protein [Streptomyces malaysiensis]|uniref:NAD-dependent epimerase/dehydratase family protein n=1 Tax=Streptomyces malaysiensis TaxID=92644 RepID=UPI001BE00B14